MSNDESPRQLSLLPSSQAPLQFRLDAATRRRGLHHIAEIRHQMAERQAQRASVTDLAPRPRPDRTHAA